MYQQSYSTVLPGMKSSLLYGRKVPEPSAMTLTDLLKIRNLCLNCKPTKVTTGRSESDLETGEIELNPRKNNTIYYILC